MQWLADECVDAGLIFHLREAGHDVYDAWGDLAGRSDAELLGVARAQQRLMLTEDRDFGDLVFRAFWNVPGVVLVRIVPEQKALKWPQLDRAISAMGERLFGRFTVIEAQRFRSRPLPRP